MGAILSSFAAWLIKWILYAVQYVAGVVAGVVDSVLYYARLVLYTVINPLFDLLVTLLDGSGVGAAIATINAAWTGPLGYWAGYFLIPQAGAAILAAYVVRFLIRRIPFIG